MEFVTFVAFLLIAVFVYFMFGGQPLGINPKDDDPSKEHWPFHNERLTK